MNTVPFDTLRLSRALQSKAQFTLEQAEGFTDALTDSFQDQLATKSDLNAEIGGLRAELYKVAGVQTLAIIGAVLAIMHWH